MSGEAFALYMSFFFVCSACNNGVYNKSHTNPPEVACHIHQICGVNKIGNRVNQVQSKFLLCRF